MTVASCLVLTTTNAVLLPAGSGVSLYQLDFRGGPNANVGEIVVDRSLVNAAGGITSGFVNVADGSGNWLVRNLPVFDAATADADRMSTHFNMPGISNGTDVSSMNLCVDYSSSPVTSFASSTLFTYPTPARGNAVGGLPLNDVNGYRAGPDYSLVNFSLGPISVTYQAEHENVQAANNQCAPAAVANSLSWLRKTKGLPVQEENTPGTSGQPMLHSLVGTLEHYMDRPVTARVEGKGQWPLDGKLRYLAASGLDNKLVVKHVGGGGAAYDYSSGTETPLSGGADYSALGATSHGQGALTWEWIQSELAHGEDVELCFAYAGGGSHYVEVTGAGTLFGVPFITHVSDQLQTDKDPMDALGCDTTQFDFMIGTFLTGENATAIQAISESVPEPGAAMIMVAVGALRRRRHRVC
jgi:hypothetical protein